MKKIGESAFNFCSGLTSIIIPSLVTEISDGTFQNCSALSAIVVPKSVTRIGDHAFFQCIQLSSISLPVSVTEIGRYAFYGCSELTSFTLPWALTKIGERAFEYCWGLTYIFIPETVTEIGDAPFANCNNLIEIYVSETNQNYTSNDGVLFSKDMSKILEFPGGKGGEYVIPETVTEIGDYAFYWCTDVTSISFTPILSKIGDYAFNYCMGLTSIYLPASLTGIGENAFFGCRNLTSVHYAAENPISAPISVFDVDWEMENSIIYQEATLYVPKTAMEKCREINPWKNFRKIEAYETSGIEDLNMDADNADSLVKYYNLNGMRVSGDALVPGLYIKKQGGKSTKVMVK